MEIKIQTQNDAAILASSLIGFGLSFEYLNEGVHVFDVEDEDWEEGIETGLGEEYVMSGGTQPLPLEIPD